MGKYQLKSKFEGLFTHNQTINLTMPIEPDFSVSLSAVTITGVVSMDDYEYSIFQAVSENNLKAVNTAIAKGVDLQMRDSKGRTALHIAVSETKPEMVRLLMSYGVSAEADPENEESHSALIELADDFGEDDEDVLEILRLLIDYGVDLNSVDDQKETALMDAILYDDLEAAEMLIKAGADTSLRDDDNKTLYSKADNDDTRQFLNRFGIYQ